MSRFIGELETKLKSARANDGRGAWELLQSFGFQSDAARAIFVVPKGFVTDYASVPRMPVVFWLAGDTSHEAAVVHDFLYQSHLVSRAMADAVFREASRVAGVPGWRRWIMWAGVRVGGGLPWDRYGAGDVTK